jgi:hypothetical protein
VDEPVVHEHGSVKMTGFLVATQDTQAMEFVSAVTSLRPNAEVVRLVLIVEAAVMGRGVSDLFDQAEPGGDPSQAGPDPDSRRPSVRES